jgi:hypothetical protein
MGERFRRVVDEELVGSSQAGGTLGGPTVADSGGSA